METLMAPACKDGQVEAVMNLIRLGPDIRFDRPLALDKIGEGKLISVAPVEDIIPPTGITEELRAGVLDCTATAARWRQAAFHSQEVAEAADRGMPEVQAGLHHKESVQHLAALGVIETARQPDIPAAELPVAA